MAVVLFLAGCGGDGDAEESVAARPTTTTTSTTAPTTTITTAATVAPPETTATTAATGTSATTRSPAPTTPASTTTSSTAAPTTSAPPPPPQSTTTAAPPPTSGQATITIQNFAYSPVVLQVTAGTEVRAVNRDSATHTWTADDGSWDSGALAKDGEFARRFTAAGSFAYHCAIHPSMKGSVQVSG